MNGQSAAASSTTANRRQMSEQQLRKASANQPKRTSSAAYLRQAAGKRKSVTLLGPANEHAQALAKKLDEQCAVVARGARPNNDVFGELLARPKKDINLAFTNKYVGYCSARCRVTLETTRAEVLQMNDQLASQRGGKSSDPDLDFPVLITIERTSGQVIVAGRSRDSVKRPPLKLAQEDLFEVKVLDLASFGEDPPDMQPYAPQEILGAKEQPTDGQSDAEKPWRLWLQQVARSEEGGVGQPAGKYKYPFQVRARTSAPVFFAPSREERDILVHEINAICQESNPDVLLMTARQDVMHLIDPVEAFNAYNLSVQWGPKTAEQEAFHAALRRQRQAITEQEQIIEQRPGYVVYVRDGLRCYISATLRKELYITDGLLMKEPQVKVRILKSKYYQTFVTIDFKRDLIRFKKSGETRGSTEEFVTHKDVPFADVIEVKSLELDVFAKEHNNLGELPFRAKFMVRTLGREHIFFAPNEKERAVWLESLAKVLESNKHGTTAAFSLKSAPDASAIKRGSVSLLPDRRSQLVQSGEIYKSHDLQVTGQAIEGKIMKAIEHRSVFHGGDYHERYFRLEFGQAACHFYDKKPSGKPQRSHQQVDLVGCHSLDEDQIIEKVSNREGRRRSNSFVRKMFSKESKQCKWNFAFTVTFREKEYELYAPTRIEREQWVKILSTVAEMNRQGVRLETQTPFEFMKDQSQLTRGLIEESKLGATAKELQLRKEAEKQTKDEVFLWIKLNSDLLIKDREPVEPYLSEQLTITQDGARGTLFIVMPGSVDDENPGEKLVDQFTSIEMFLNFKTQMLLLQKRDTEGIQKLTFHEIDFVESCEYETTNEERSSNSFMKMAVKNNSPKLVACLQQADRDKWVKMLGVIIKMRKLALDFGKISIFTFDKYYRKQEKLLQASHQNQDNEEEYKNEEENYDFALKEKASTLKDKVIESNRKSRKSIKETVSDKVGTMQTGTFFRTFRCIEGYLCKENEQQTAIRLKKRQLRYFRIIFNTGKFNIKEDKAYTAMRSFLLKDLITVQSYDDEPRETVDQIADQPEELLSKDEVYAQYNVNEIRAQKTWPYMFKVEFTERSFELGARTQTERYEWVRAFSLILRMNKIDISVIDKNPYVFESQERNLAKTNSKEAIDNVAASLSESAKSISITDQKIQPEKKSTGTGGGVVNEPHSSPVVNYNINVQNITIQQIQPNNAATANPQNNVQPQPQPQASARQNNLFDGVDIPAEAKKQMDEVIGPSGHEVTQLAAKLALKKKLNKFSKQNAVMERSSSVPDFYSKVEEFNNDAVIAEYQNNFSHKKPIILKQDQGLKRHFSSVIIDPVQQQQQQLLEKQVSQTDLVTNFNEKDEELVGSLDNIESDPNLHHVDVSLSTPVIYHNVEDFDTSTGAPATSGAGAINDIYGDNNTYQENQLTHQMNRGNYRPKIKQAKDQQPIDQPYNEELKKINLSKIRLSGSQESLKTYAEVKNINQSSFRRNMSQIELHEQPDLQNAKFASLMNVGDQDSGRGPLSRRKLSTMGLDMNVVKSIARSGSTNNIAASNYNTAQESGQHSVVMNSAQPLGLHNRKRSRILRIRKKHGQDAAAADKQIIIEPVIEKIDTSGDKFLIKQKNFVTETSHQIQAQQQSPKYFSRNKKDTLISSNSSGSFQIDQKLAKPDRNARPLPAEKYNETVVSDWDTVTGPQKSFNATALSDWD